MRRMSALSHSLDSSFQEFAIKDGQSPADEFREIAQRWHDQMAFHGHSVAEKYAKGRIPLVCNLHISFPGRDERMAGMGNSPFRDGECSASFVYVADIPNVLQLEMGNQQAMFVHNVETVETPDGRLRSLPRRAVWLAR